MSPKEIAERTLEPSEERNSLTWEQIQTLARAYLELLFDHEATEKVYRMNRQYVEDSKIEITKLKEENAGLIEALKFYADRNNWKCWDTYTDVKDVITVSDLGCKSYSEKADYAIPSGGRRANEALKKWGGV